MEIYTNTFLWHFYDHQMQTCARWKSSISKSHNKQKQQTKSNEIRLYGIDYTKDEFVVYAIERAKHVTWNLKIVSVWVNKVELPHITRRHGSRVVHSLCFALPHTHTFLLLNSVQCACAGCYYYYYRRRSHLSGGSLATQLLNTIHLFSMSYVLQYSNLHFHIFIGVMPPLRPDVFWQTSLPHHVCRFCVFFFGGFSKKNFDLRMKIIFRFICCVCHVSVCGSGVCVCDT